jgi:hypothetical protein
MKSYMAKKLFYAYLMRYFSASDEVSGHVDGLAALPLGKELWYSVWSSESTWRLWKREKKPLVPFGKRIVV